MRILLSVVLLGGLAGSGCIGKKGGSAANTEPPPAAFASIPGEAPAPTESKSPEAKPAETTESKPKLIVTPDSPTVTGKVVKVNAAARFAVLSFPLGHLPPMEQRLNVTRRGLKVGEVKITGPQQEENIVADIVAGDAEEGDEVSGK